MADKNDLSLSLSRNMLQHAVPDMHSFIEYPFRANCCLYARHIYHSLHTYEIRLRCVPALASRILRTLARIRNMFLWLRDFLSISARRPRVSLVASQSQIFSGSHMSASYLGIFWGPGECMQCCVLIL